MIGGVWMTKHSETPLKSENSKATSGTYKLLMVGNSFAEDAAYWLWNICQSAGIDAVIGVIEIGGCSLEQHWERIQHNEDAPFHKWDRTGRIDRMIPYRDVFRDEEWMVITFQQFSGKSGQYETFHPYLTHLRDYAKKFALHSDVKFGWHMTWAYANGSQHSEFVHYDNDQMVMYDAIVEATQQVMDELDFDIVIPSGTAIQNGRTHKYLSTVGDELTRDGYHLNVRFGRFVAALTVFETLIAKRYHKDIFNDVLFMPVKSDIKSLSQWAKKAAKQAVVKPYEVSDI